MLSKKQLGALRGLRKEEEREKKRRCSIEWENMSEGGGGNGEELLQ